MSIYELHAYLFRLKSDPAVKRALADDAKSHLAKQALEPAEREALIKGDIIALWNMGVHPLLLIPYAQAMKMSPLEYKRTLAPLAGQRRFRS